MQLATLGRALHRTCSVRGGRSRVSTKNTAGYGALLRATLRRDKVRVPYVECCCSKVAHRSIETGVHTLSPVPILGGGASNASNRCH